jgi:hypothetical protein
MVTGTRIRPVTPRIRCVPDMFGKSLWNLVKNLDMFSFSENFGLEKVFDDLPFTNSPNAPLDIMELQGHKIK